MKKYSLLALLSLGLLLTGCGFGGNVPGGGGNGGGSGSGEDIDYDDVDGDPDDSDFDDMDEPTGDFTITTSVSGGYSCSDNVYTITKAGEYTLSGKLEGRIYINAGDDDEVDLNLNGVSITSAENSPIFCVNADKLKVKSEEDTDNFIIDSRSEKVTDSDDQGEGALNAKCDLSLTGKGVLSVTGSYNNGVHTTKDLSIKNVSLKSTAVNNAIKGKNSVSIESGNIFAISVNGDGIETEDSDVSSKGNQKGTITVTGGAVNVYSYGDAINAAYDVDISADDPDNPPVFNIFTNAYATEYLDGSITTESGTMYLAIKSSAYSSGYRYATYFYNDSDYVWKDASYVGSSNTSGSTYYYYRVSQPASYQNFAVYCYSSYSTDNSTTSYIAASTTMTVNSEKNTLVITGYSNKVIQTSGWTTFDGNVSSTGNGKAAESAKGIKADNKINISAGKFAIKTYDDALHANYGTELENSSKGVGDLTISGGYFEIYAADDGIHADHSLNIEGGTIKIARAYEGIEGNLINISGGDITVYASDDGLNAANKSGVTPAITVSGGTLSITLGSGDVDGIDSNGSFTQTGGTIVTRGAPNSTSTMATGLDTDGTARITGGTFICIGPMENAPTLSNTYTVLFGCSSVSNGGHGGGPGGGGGGHGGGGGSSSDTTFTSGDYVISGIEVSFTLEYSYYGIRTFSSLYSKGSSYSLSGPVTASGTAS